MKQIGKKEIISKRLETYSIDKLYVILNNLLKNNIKEIEEDGLNDMFLTKDKKNGELTIDKRDSSIETIQLEIIKRVVCKIAKNYYKNIEFDFSDWNTNKNNHKWFLKEDGSIKERTKVKNEMNAYNKVYDSKTFDSVLSVTIDGNLFTLFFILKGVENSGGHQDNVLGEIGKYTDLIQKNTNDNYHFFFVLDGKYINENKEKFHESKKYVFATSETIENEIENFIKNNLKYGK